MKNDDPLERGGLLTQAQEDDCVRANRCPGCGERIRMIQKPGGHLVVCLSEYYHVQFQSLDSKNPVLYIS